jgi:pimeloyl-ACP methyl ester carboxylesterase
MARWDAATMDAALAAVRVPVLVIQSTTRNAELKRTMLKAGESSPYLDLLKKGLKNARVEVVPETGHFTMLEAAERVNRLISGFAAGGR